MSSGLVPSKSTVYISNLPYDLKHNDLHKIFEKHGKIVKVTVLKDRANRRSKGVAFILFLSKEDAKKCADATDRQEMFGRTLSASIAKDNGRSTEFIRRKNYPDKSQCYECGEIGHLSYDCSKNLLGARDPPPKKVRKRKKKEAGHTNDGDLSYYDSDEGVFDETGKLDEEEEPDEETLSAAIAQELEREELEKYRQKVASGDYADEDNQAGSSQSRKKIKKSSYFSDEEESD